MTNQEIANEMQSLMIDMHKVSINVDISDNGVFTFRTRSKRLASKLPVEMCYMRLKNVKYNIDECGFHVFTATK